MLGILLLLAPVAAAEEDSPEQLAAARAFIARHQTSAGGFATRLPEPGQEAIPSLRTTRTALRAFRLLQGTVPNRPAVEQYLFRCYDANSGGFADRPGLPPDPVSTSVALMILKEELKLPVEPYAQRGFAFINAAKMDFEQIRMVASGVEALATLPPAAPEWLRIIDELRNPDGSYGSGPGLVRTTALRVVARQRLGGTVDAPAELLKILNAGRRDDGGFGGDQAGGSDLESCYRIVRLFSRLDSLPEQPERLRAFVVSCRNADGGFGVRPGSPSTLHGTYYATIVRHWLKGGK